MKNVPLTAIAGQTFRIPLVVKDAEGTPLPLDAYNIYGAVDNGCSAKTGMTVLLIEPGVACLSIPPLQTGRYEYDLFMRHQATSTETRLLRGAITVQSRVATLPPAQSTAEQIDIVLSPEHTVLEISLSPVTIVSAADWQQIQQAADRAEQAADRAEATLPALEQEIAAARTTIEQEADQAARHAAAETADLIAATGETASAAVREEAARATFSALEAISTAEATAINQATNTGINAIGQSITAGTTAIETAVTSGTGTISDKVTASLQLIDGYVGTTTDDLARYSRGGQWGGIQTFNAPVVFNGGGIVSTGSSFASDPFSDTQRITGLLDSQYLQAMYGGRSLPLAFETHATDAHYDGSRVQGMSTMQGKPSTIGAWQCAWLTSQTVIQGSIFIRANTPTGSTRRVISRTGRYAVNILPLVTATDRADTHPPVVVGLNAFFTGHSTNDNLPPLRWPWQPQIYPQPHHANWNQPKAIVCCEAYGHRIPSIVVYVGYGGSITDKDVTPNVIKYNCIPCVRYKSPIVDVSTITTYYVTSDDNSNSYSNAKNPTYIQTSDGLLVAVPGTPLDTRHCSLGMLAISKASTQATACIRDIVQYPNIKPATAYETSNVQFQDPIHPIEKWLASAATHKLTVPAANKKLMDKISIAYTAAAPEEYPYEYTGANIVSGTIQGQPYGNYGKTITISAAAQDITITCPSGWIIDVDDWAADWCEADGNTLHLLPNATDKTRYTSIWIYAPDNNNNNSDGTNLIYEYIINQTSQA